jgi:hypothetical protein
MTKFQYLNARLAYPLLLCIICIFALGLQSSRDNYIFGKWRCVKLDTRGYQKYSLKQAKIIKRSVLNFERNKIYYSDIDFIKSCYFFKLKLSQYDTLLSRVYYNMNLEVIYPKSDLAKILVIELVDSNGRHSCFNNCAELFLKQDTLINVCGGYTFYL